MKGQGLETKNQKRKASPLNHSNSQSCINNISRTVLGPFSKRMRKATTGQIIQCISRSIRPNTSSMKRNANEGLKNLEKMLKDCKLCGMKTKENK
jgi:hypothetical protein